MRITDIRETAVPLKSTLANSSFNFSEMTTSVVAVITDMMREGKPVCGFAFNSTGRYACGAQMRARFIPRILNAEPTSLLDDAGDNFDPAKILAVMMRNEKAGGHSERSVAIGTIEVAVWDAVAKIEGKPLHRVLAERYNGGKVADKVFCYVGGGWYAPGKTTKDLQDEMRRHLDSGYTMVKMKVGGAPLAEDMSRIEAVKAVIGNRGALAVDANCKFTRDEAITYAKAMSPYKLRWYEEPCDPLDYASLAAVSEIYDGALSTGENLFSTQDVENLVRFGALKADRGDVIQVDPPQAYGIVQYARTLDMLAKHGWPRSGLFPHGGNQMSLAIAAGFGLGGAESYPGVFGPFAGFADDARLEDGYLSLSDRPGIGFEGQAALYKIMRDLAGI
ncbi:MAG TPA: enolase C-terminal domain-like protein [Pseudolabrys sp.]|nr:enolase C-terminal domain-like protein [Pseudolabrys sp.]